MYIYIYSLRACVCTYIHTYTHSLRSASTARTPVAEHQKKKIKHCHGAPSGCAVSKAASNAAAKQRHQADAPVAALLLLYLLLY